MEWGVPVFWNQQCEDSAWQSSPDVRLYSATPTPIGLNGMRIDHSAAATDSLLTDLRSDKGMDWVPTSGWLTKVVIDGSAAQLKYDLAISATAAAPSPVAAGLEAPVAPLPLRSQLPELAGFAIAGLALVALGGVLILRAPAPAAR